MEHIAYEILIGFLITHWMPLISNVLVTVKHTKIRLLSYFQELPNNHKLLVDAQNFICGWTSSIYGNSTAGEIVAKQ